MRAENLSFLESYNGSEGGAYRRDVPMLKLRARKSTLSPVSEARGMVVYRSYRGYRRLFNRGVIREGDTVYTFYRLVTGSILVFRHEVINRERVRSRIRENGKGVEQRARDVFRGIDFGVR